MRFKLVIEQEFETPEMMASFATNYATFLRGLGIDPEKPKAPIGERGPELIVPRPTTEMDRAREIPGVKSNTTIIEKPESSGDETAAAVLPAATPRADDTGGSLPSESDAVPPAAPRRRRGRPSKETTEQSAPVVQTPVVEQPKPAQNEAAALFDTPVKKEEPAVISKTESTAPAAGEITKDMVKGLYAEALEPDDGEEQILAVHKQHGFIHLRDCPPEKYAALYADLKALIKRQKAAALV